MSKLRPYLAIDIETTGLDIEKVHCIQIGWVLDDGVSPREQLEKGSFIIDVDKITYGEPYALWLNGWIFDQMVKAAKGKETKYPVTCLADALCYLCDAVKKVKILANKWDEANGEKPKKVQLAGKNASGFDWPIIFNNAKDNELCQSVLNNLVELIDHRFIDVGGAYFDLFGKNPGFDQINKLIQYKEITHDAVDDAMNVVVALRYRMGMNF